MIDEPATNDIDPRISQLDIERFAADWPDTQLEELLWFAESVANIETDINVRWQAATIQWKELVLYLADAGLTNYLLPIQPDPIARWLSVRIKRGLAHTKYFRDLDPSVLAVGYSADEVDDLWRGVPVDDIQRSYDLLVPFAEQHKLLVHLYDTCKAARDVLDRVESATTPLDVQAGLEADLRDAAQTIATAINDLTSFVGHYQHEPEFLRAWAAVLAHGYGLSLLSVAAATLNRIEAAVPDVQAVADPARVKVVVTALYVLDFRFDTSEAVIDIMLVSRVKTFIEADDAPDDVAPRPCALDGTRGSADLTPLGCVTAGDLIEAVTHIPGVAGRHEALNTVLQHALAALPPPDTAAIDDAHIKGWPEYQLTHNDLAGAGTRRHHLLTDRCLAGLAGRLDLNAPPTAHETSPEVRGIICRLLPALLMFGDEEDVLADDSEARRVGEGVLRASQAIPLLLRVIRQRSGRFESRSHALVDDVLAAFAPQQDGDVSHEESFGADDEDPVDRAAAINTVAALAGHFGSAVIGDVLLDCPAVLATLLAPPAPPVVLLRCLLSRDDSASRLQALENSGGGAAAIASIGAVNDITNTLHHAVPIIPARGDVFSPAFTATVVRNHHLNVLLDIYRRVCPGPRPSTGGVPDLHTAGDSQAALTSEMARLLARSCRLTAREWDQLATVTWTRLHLLWVLQGMGANEADSLAAELDSTATLLELAAMNVEAPLLPFHRHLSHLLTFPTADVGMVAGKQLIFHRSSCRPTAEMLSRYPNRTVPQLIRSMLRIISDVDAEDGRVLARRSASAIDGSGPGRWDRVTEVQAGLIALAGFYLSVCPVDEMRLAGSTNAEALEEWLGHGADVWAQMADEVGFLDSGATGDVRLSVKGSVLQSRPVRHGVRLHVATEMGMTVAEIDERYYFCRMEPEEAALFFGAD